MLEVLQIPGALLILSGFTAAQLRRLSTDSGAYLAVNTLGSPLLAVVALLEAQWGFLLLEGTWAGVSVFGMYRRLRRSTR